jgi:hypothetical protein
MSPRRKRWRGHGSGLLISFTPVVRSIGVMPGKT